MRLQQWSSSPKNLLRKTQEPTVPNKMKQIMSNNPTQKKKIADLVLQAVLILSLIKDIRGLKEAKNRAQIGQVKLDWLLERLISDRHNCSIVHSEFQFFNK